MIKALDMDSLTLDQKIGQMMIARSPVDEESWQFTLELIRNRSLGGIHIRRIDSRPAFPMDSEKVKAMVRQIKEIADYPILICEDMENGYGEGQVTLPSPMALSSANDSDLAYEFGSITAREAKQDGYNLVFGPLLDIGMNPLSSCQGQRTFGASKEQVAKIAGRVIDGYQSEGFVVTGKHYPGFGASPVDSHIDMVVLDSDEKELLDRELYPYLVCAREHAMSGVMTGHIMVPKIDPEYPASLSRKLIGLLRNAGFDGLIITDSLAMVGLTGRYGLANSHKLAMAAGNDMILCDYRTSVIRSYQWLKEAYSEGLISEAAINAAVDRVIAAQKLTISDTGRKPAKPVGARELALASDMAARSIAVRLNGVSGASIDPDARHLFLIQQGNLYPDPATGKILQEPSGVDSCEKELKELFPNSEFRHIQAYPGKFELEAALAAALSHTSVVMVLNGYTLSYAGSSDSTKRMIALMKGLHAKLSAILQFGNPYAAREYLDCPRILFGFDGALCQKYTALILAGKRQAVGTLPIAFPEAPKPPAQPSAPRYTAVIFDLDGVICFTDRYHYLAWKEIADELGIYFDETINNRLRGVSRLESLRIILSTAGRTLSEEEELFYMQKKNDRYRSLLQTMTPDDLSPEVRKTLDELRSRRFKLAIGSSSRNTGLILNQIGLSGYFDAVSDGNNISRSKPDPEVFLKAADILGVPAGKCLVVEDASAGVQAAKAGGMDCAAIGDAAKSGLADYSLSGFADLLLYTTF
ncbi:MAG: beta-phosphoglucomutase [Lachnospiraceae bacterium]|nr:beta-phosphoglucomutase [Lachnospiraceae bacterium]